MSFEKVSYSQVPFNDACSADHDVEDMLSARSETSKLRWALGNLLHISFAFIILAQSIAILLLYRSTPGTCTSINGMSLRRTQPRTIYQHSAYISANSTEANIAWEAILPGYGVVAITPEYISSKKLPPSIELPNTNGKHAYVIEAYHAIHCIKNLRTHFLALQANTTWAWSYPHDMHCFDALRQYVMCNIDDTLLHTWGKRDSGHNQMKMCHDWDHLRAWAGEIQAGYLDTEPGMGFEHVGEVWVGDGLPVGALS